MARTWFGLRKYLQTTRQTPSRRATFRPRLEMLEDRAVPAAVRAGFDAATLGPGDDTSSGPVALGFAIDYFNNPTSTVFVNNNGNLTFGSAFAGYSPSALGTLHLSIVAPFWADVDTRGVGSGTTRYGTGTVDGHAAFGGTWRNVGYYNQHADKLNTFQAIVVDRADITPGSYDLEFNYDHLQWDTGDGSGSARAGYASSSSQAWEFAGSATKGAFLDGGPSSLAANSNVGVAGRYLFAFRSPTASISGPTTVSEGGSITLTGKGFSPAAPIAKYEWDFNYDGVTFDIDSTTQTTVFSAAAIDGPATRTVGFRVLDGQGNRSPVQSQLITIANAPPAIMGFTLNGSPTVTINEGGSVTLSGKFTDPARLMSTETFTGLVQWGDGSSSPLTINAANGTFSASHVYLDDPVSGTPADKCTVSITLTDDDGGTASATGLVIVNNVAPTADSFTILGGVDGSGLGTVSQAIKFQTTASDSGTLDSFTYQFDWDYDGVTFDVEDTVGPLAPPYRSSIGLAHTYANPGSFTPAVRVLDKDGGVSVIRLGATVNVGLSSGVGYRDENLVITGTNGTDYLTVKTDMNKAVVVYRNGVYCGSFALNDGGRVIVHGFDGDDFILVDGAVDRPLNAEVHGGAGNDTVYTGNGNDVVWGDAGDDSLSLGGGHDVGLGGFGSDQLWGGDGDDILLGGHLTGFSYGQLRSLSEEWVASTVPPASLTSLRDAATYSALAAEYDRFWGDAGKDAFLFRSGPSGDLINDYNAEARDYLLALV